MEKTIRSMRSTTVGALYVESDSDSCSLVYIVHGAV